jgi:SNF2 family DNA or RNA helicase
MVIAQKALDAFLARPMRDSAKAKTFSDEELDAKIRELGATFHTPLRWAQKICFLLAIKHKKYQLLMEMGGGKTFTSYALFENTPSKRMLVLVPNVVNLDEWQREGRLHAPNLKVAQVDVGGQKKIDLIEDEDTDVVVMTYAGLVRLCSVQASGTGKKKLALSKSIMDWLARLFDTLVLDETTSIKNHQSKTFKIVRYVSSKLEYVYGLTGTPFEKSPTDMWSQMFVIDGGHSMGETLGLFRGAFCRESRTPWALNWEFRANQTKEMSRRLKHSAIRFSASECQDLPEAQGGFAGDELLLLRSPLPKEHMGYYKAFNTELQSIQHGKVQAVSSAYTRMRMVTSGWLGVTDEDGERVELTFRDNPKLDSVVAKLLELGGEKVIIVHWFRHSGHLICQRLKQMKISHTWVYGGTSSAKKSANLESFRDPKGPQVLVASTAISKGVNLQNARYMIFFESPVSTIDRKQMEARILREGGREGCRYYYDAVCLGTKDEEVLSGLKKGIDLHDLIVDSKDK